MTNKIKIFIFIVLLSLLSLSNYTSAQSYQQAINKALQWLDTTQNEQGFWDVTDASLTTEFHQTAVIVDTYQFIDRKDEYFSTAYEWIKKYNPPQLDYLARKLRILAEEGEDISTQINELITYQTPFGGFSINKDLEGEPLTTALVLKALYAANYKDTEEKTPINNSLYFISTNQNQDGGFSPAKNQESKIHTTAIVLDAIYPYRIYYAIQPYIDNAIKFLLSRQNQDGSFGRNIFETALVYIALSGAGGIKEGVLDKAKAYILSKQLENGSWENDAYTTAVCVKALWCSALINLRLAELIVPGQNVNMGDEVEVKAKIDNLGGQLVNQVEVEAKIKK